MWYSTSRLLLLLSVLALALPVTQAQDMAPDDEALFHPTRRPKLPKAWANKTTKLDRDGDGIADTLEKTPLTFGSTGLQITLNPKRKDLLVILDHVGTGANHISLASLAPIFQAFAQSPLRGVGTSRANGGVNLIIISIAAGSGYPEADDFVLPMSGGGGIDWAIVDQIKTNLITDFGLAAFPPIFHYGLSAYESDSPSGGISRNDLTSFTSFRQGACDFTITPSNSRSVTDFVITTFMHELGHNLSLTHGGHDHGNYKPNYFSVMNYFYASGITRAAGGVTFDYSRGVATHLNEHRLLEGGIGAAAKGFVAHTWWWDGVSPSYARLSMVDPARVMDYDNNGLITKKSRQAYELDLNASGESSWLMTEDNWKNINFAGGLAMQQSLLAAKPSTALTIAAGLGLVPGIDFDANDLPNYPGRYQPYRPDLICPPPPAVAGRGAASSALSAEEQAAALAKLRVTVGRGAVLIQSAQFADADAAAD